MNNIDTKQVGLYLNDILATAKEYIDSNEIIILTSALTMMSVVLGNRVHTYDGSMSKLYPNLSTLIVAKSGLGGKSSTIKILNNMILRPIIDKSAKDFISKQKRYKSLSKEEKQDESIPRLHQIVSGQGSTFQGIIKSLENNPRGMLAIYDEARELLKKLNKDAEHKAGLTTLYDQEFYGKDLVGFKGEGESISLSNPFLSILAVTNPDWLKEETKDSDYTSGFLNRFIIIEIDKFAKLQAFKNTNIQDFTQLHKVALTIWEELNSTTSTMPIVLKIDGKVAKYYADWFDRKLDAYSESDNHIQSFLIRQLVSALKYAMILQMFDTVYQGTQLNTQTELDVDYLKKGMYLSELFMSYIEQHLENMVEDENEVSNKKIIPVEKLAQKIITYLSDEKRRGIEFNKSELMNNIRGLNAKNFYDSFVVAQKFNKELAYQTKEIGKQKIEVYYISIPKIEGNSITLSLLE